MIVRTRFAPSPTGRLHLGHALAAKVAYDLAKESPGGVFLLRHEDIDGPRVREEFYQGIEQDLKWLGFPWDGEPLRQTSRIPAYEEALAKLRERRLVYPCFCTRRAIQEEWARMAAAPQGSGSAVYPGTCLKLTEAETVEKLRSGIPHAWRLDSRKAAAVTGPLGFRDLRFGEIHADPALSGDVVLARKDIGTAYHLAVVVDDAFQQITHVTRGEDLLEATHVHRLLQVLLGLPEPVYLHHQLVLDPHGKRLAKRDDALAIATLRERGMTPPQLIRTLPPITPLRAAAEAVSLKPRNESVASGRDPGMLRAPAKSAGFLKMNHPHVAIVGATGAVGVEMLLCLEQRNFPLSKLKLLASARSAGKKMSFRGEEIVVEELTHDSFAGVDIALFSAGGGISLEFGPSAAAAGAVVIDNSSAFRMDADVPLVVPEINPEAAKNRPRGIIANPNCTTIISLMALAPLHEAFGLRSIIASTYQAVSGSGAQGIVELEEQMKSIHAGEPVTLKVYPRQIAFNVIPQVDAFTANGYTKEEMKMLNEGRKIMNLPELRVSCTCVRVPVYRSHSVSITAQFERPVDADAARAAYAGKPGVQVVDDIANRVFPVPLDTTGKDDCLVGRIRKNLVFDNALDLWVVGDQVRKGAALNAVQIAEIL